MLSNATVSLISVTETDDGLGNITVETVETVLDWALVAPRSSSERVDPRSPAVVSAASLYGPFDAVVSSVDLIVVADHSPSLNGEWEVEGRAGAWSLNGWRPGLEVALRRAGGTP